MAEAVQAHMREIYLFTQPATSPLPSLRAPFRLQVTHLAGVGEDSMFMGVIQVGGGQG